MVSKKLISLQVLRALAAFLVLFHHIFNTTLGRVSVFHAAYSNNFGAIGVDIFFVLSGTVMTIITVRQKKSAIAFFKKRCIRIIPIYWFVAPFAAVVLYICFKKPVTIESIIKTLTILPVLNRHQFGTLIVTVAWTLSFEFLFYIVFSIAIWRSPSKASLLAFAIIALLVVVGICFKFSDYRLTFLTNPLMAEFLLGCICAWIFLSPLKFNKWLSVVLLITSLLFLFRGAFFGFDDAIAHEGNIQNAKSSLLRVWQWGMPAFVLVLCFLMAEKSGAFKAPSFAVKLGDASYSLYLLHVPLIIVIQTLFSSFHVAAPNFYFMVCIAACLISAYYLHIFVELPLLAFFTNRRLPHPKGGLFLNSKKTL